ncbi:hypothetical protein GX48_00506 [Paracoccidioides brasiliensis]|nr:hypothetical protein GX48_00506 [Paracoccidioides brasiliensis]
MNLSNLYGAAQRLNVDELGRTAANSVAHCFLDLRDEWRGIDTDNQIYFISDTFSQKEAVAQLEVDATRADSSIETMTLLEQRFESLWLEKAVVEYEGYEKVKAALRKGRVGFLVVYCGQLEKWEGNFRRVVTI